MRDDFYKLKINLENIEEIAYTELDEETNKDLKIMHTGESDRYIIKALLTELYYYSLLNEKVIDIKPEVESFIEVLRIIENEYMYRKTDLLDSMHSFYSLQFNEKERTEKEKEYKKEYDHQHSIVWINLCGNKRTLDDYCNLMKKASTKLIVYTHKKRGE